MRKLIIILLILLTLALPVLAEEAAEPLFPAKGENGKWGYINTRAEWVIAPQYDLADDFYGNYARVWLCPEGMTMEETLGGWWGYDRTGLIDRSGLWIIEPAYTIRRSSNGDYWRVSQESPDGTRVGVIDTATGTFSGLLWTSEAFQEASSSRSPANFGRVFQNGLTFKLDNEAFAPSFMRALYLADTAGHRVSETYWVEDTTPLTFENGPIPVKSGVHWRYLGENGKITIHGPFTQAAPFCNGLALVRIGDRAGYIDREGNEIFFWACE